MTEQKESSSNAGLGCLFIIACLVVIAAVAYNGLNDAGWIPHSHTVDLYFKGEWLVDENRTCLGFQEKPSTQSAPEIGAIACPASDYMDATPHNMSITFWGKISRPDAVSISNFASFEWRCTRKQDGFTCYALN